VRAILKLRFLFTQRVRGFIAARARFRARWMAKSRSVRGLPLAQAQTFTESKRHSRFQPNFTKINSLVSDSHWHASCAGRGPTNNPIFVLEKEFAFVF
jgi:hypothetical protein